MDVCPAPGKALEMVSVQDELKEGRQEQADYFFNNVTYKNVGTNNVKNLTSINHYLSLVEHVRVVEKLHILKLLHNYLVSVC